MAEYQNTGGPPTVIPISRKRFDELGLDPSEFSQCARPINGQVVGCSEYFRCRLKEKETGAGPVIKGVRATKKDHRGRHVVQNQTIDCFMIPHRKSELELNDGSLKVIASSGEKITLRGSVPVDENVPGEGMKRRIEDRLIETIIPEYKDPNSEELLGLTMAREVFEQDSAASDAEREAELERIATTPVSGRNRQSSR